MSSQAIRWLFGLETFGIKLGLDATRALLDRLGRPDRAYRTVLVGGTNGKGSVAAMLEAMLLASGRRAGLYTSPHLVRPTERARILGRDVSTERLAAALEVVREASERCVAEGILAAPPSFFEAVTAASLLLFAEAGLEVAVLEVGLGGRLDATNVVEPTVSVVVTVGLDHTDRLGDSLEAIALEKAGIARADRPFVCGVEQEEALGPIRRACEAAGAPLVEVGAVAKIEGEEGPSFSVRTETARYDALVLPLLGAHQRANAAVAIVAFEQLARQLSFEPDPLAVRRGLREVRWPGRLQWVPGSPPLLLDGAHNAAGARALSAYLDTLPGPRPVGVLAASKDKDVRGILAPLAARLRKAVLTRASVRRAADPAALEEAARAVGLDVGIEPGVGPALDRGRQLAEPGGFVLVTGSLYLVGDVLALLEGDEASGPVDL